MRAKRTCYFLFTLGWLTLPGVAQPLPALQQWLATSPDLRPALATQPFAHAPLNRQQARQATALLLAAERARRADTLQQSWADKAITNGEHVLRFDYRLFGEKPRDGRSLFISMHGGGNTKPEVNDQQWKNQLGLYQPAEGVYVAPRAPTNTWNLWHQDHIDPLLDALIQAAVLTQGVNPDKVYIMGYSAGGDGVYQLAPRMADRWAAAAMMAGHPNEVTPVNLRNIGFALHMGALDKAYDRNQIARRWGHWLDSLQTTDPGGYKHQVALHQGRGHWMQREDSVAVPWMLSFRRNPVPARVVWKQDDRTHPDFYWLAVPADQARAGQEVVAFVTGNTITLEKNDYDTLLIRLSDAMMDLDKPVELRYAGQRIFRGRVARTLRTLQRTIAGRFDAGLVFPAELVVSKKGGQLVVTVVN